MTDPKRIEKLNQSPCFKCGHDDECAKRITRNYKLGVIRDIVYGNRDYNYTQCPIRIALTVADMVEVDNG